MSGAYSTTQKTAGPWVDIDLGALCANYAFIRDQAPGVETAVVVKCDAYGLGLEAVACALASRENCQIFFVAYPEEGAALRDYLGVSAPDIYVFNGPLPETMPLFEQARLTPVLNSLEQASAWAQRMPGVVAALHIDTGMNRLGAPINELDAIAAINNLNISLVMSHLACSSAPTHPKNQLQRECFIDASGRFPGVRLSLSASGGALMGKDYHFDLLRPGIALYGGSPFDEDEPRLRSVAALRAPVVQLRNGEAGETVGYGAAHQITQKTRLATVALGYGDGFPRAGSGQAEAFIGDARAPLIGQVSMDLISLDVCSVKNPVKTGDIATFFGEGVSLFEAAKACNTIPYKLLTGLGARVDRRYF
ncbi:MAG: alanine racemase [Marinicaulis sp.]|nr:alanine racemase [Marinicaulis sp.]